MTLLDDTIVQIVTKYPRVVPHLGEWFKTYDYYLRTLNHMVSNVYGGYMGGEFRDILSDLVYGQLTNAFDVAMRDAGLDDITPNMAEVLAGMIESERAHIEDFYRAIIDARVDGTSIQPLLVRAQLWANRWNDAYNEATRQIAIEKGERMVWKYGDTQHCETCAALNGIVAFASEWEAAGLRPQNPPNQALSCQGWRCQCTLEVTNKRRSPKALDRLLDIAVGGNIGKHYSEIHPGTGTDQSVHGGGGGGGDGGDFQAKLKDKIELIRNNKNEHRFILDKNSGEVLAEGVGTSHSVNLNTTDYFAKPANSVVDLHNHPDGSPPSDQDWMQLGYSVTDKVVVTTKDKTYILQKPDDFSLNVNQIRDMWFETENDFFENEYNGQNENDILRQINEKMEKKTGIRLKEER